ncbi:MAG: ABC-type nitrate/sulfonate/bicarbonate transport system permease component [Alphaproteobacteria bacterium]|jgi:ABC-type nitrate/sulfonate/bicarbonate transport system permease component
MSKFLALVNSDRRSVRWGTVFLSLLAGGLLWEWVGWSSNQAIMAPLIGGGDHPGTIPRLYKYLVHDEEYLLSLLQSVQLFTTGFTLALLGAIPFGIVLARFATLRVALESYILMLYVTPMIALIPFVMSIFGFDFWPKVLVVYLFAYFPILYNTLEGARSVKPELLEVAKSFRSSEIAIWRDILIPYTLPYALTGIRQAAGRALVGMVAAEFLLSTSGLGEELITASRNFDMAGVLATILVITGLGIAFMRTAQAFEQKYAAWRGINR